VKRLLALLLLAFVGATTSPPVNVPITIVAPGCSIPISITLSPTFVSAPDSDTSGTLLSTASVTMSDGTPYAGTISSSNALFTTSGMQIRLARDLTPADDGTVSPVITPQPALCISFNPPNPSVAASAPGGTVVTAIGTAWSDGSTFSGTLAFGSPHSDDGGVFAISGSNLIINPSGPGLSGDAGIQQNVTITATQ